MIDAEVGASPFQKNNIGKRATFSSLVTVGANF
jgi:hypothetical protein